MKPIPALTLAAVLLGAAAMPTASAQAAPLGAAIGVLDASKPVVEQVQVRRRVVRRRGAGRDGALAAGLIGAAIVGGAIIAQSQRDRSEERAYYYGNGYYGDGYNYDAYGNPVRVRRQPQYYSAPGYYQSPGYYQQPGYAYPQRHHHFRGARDPAGGGQMDPTYRP